MQACDSLPLDDNYKIGDDMVMGRHNISLFLQQSVLVSSKKADPQLEIGPSGRKFGDFPYL